MPHDEIRLPDAIENAEQRAPRRNDGESPAERLIIGTMTGTSIDGLDAALVSIEGHGQSMRARLVRLRSERFPEDLARRLRLTAEQQPTTAGDLARLALDFGAFHADAIEPLMAGHAIALVVVHGQTVFHAPPASLQLINPAPITVRFGCPVLSDLRAVDLAAGGQGAPITPLADWILFRTTHRRAILNLGGFANATLLNACNDVDVSPEGVRGFDVCACNQILDAIARRALGVAFDVDGAAAAAGSCDDRASAELVELLATQRAARRSLGTGDEASAWIERNVARLSPPDLAASAANAIGSAIGRALFDAGIRGDADLVVAGGGARHRPLVAAIARTCGCAALRSDELGVPLEAREAMEMAVLGALAIDGEAITLPQVTGRRSHTACDGALWRVRR